MIGSVPALAVAVVAGLFVAAVVGASPRLQPPRGSSSDTPGQGKQGRENARFMFRDTRAGR